MIHTPVVQLAAHASTHWARMPVGKRRLKQLVNVVAVVRTRSYSHRSRDTWKCSIRFSVIVHFERFVSDAVCLVVFMSCSCMLYVWCGVMWCVLLCVMCSYGPRCLVKNPVYSIIQCATEFHNLINYWPIFQKLSTGTLHSKFAIKWRLRSHHTGDVSLLYLVKC